MSSNRLDLARRSLKPVRRAPPLVQHPKSNIVSPAPAPEKFNLFSFLPTELRLGIWETYLLTTRIIIVTETPNPQNRYSPHYHSPCGPPALLLTSQEARSVALSLQIQGEIEYISTTENTKLHFNPEIDILYFNEDVSPYHFINNSPVNDVRKIRRLAVQDNRLKELGFYIGRSTVFKTLGLEELVVVFDGDTASAKAHCEKCKRARREVGFGEGKVGWKVPTWDQYTRMGKGDEEALQGRERAYKEILGAWVKGGNLWEWVWEVVHEGS
jgi:2EXR family